MNIIGLGFIFSVCPHSTLFFIYYIHAKRFADENDLVCLSLFFRFVLRASYTIIHVYKLIDLLQLSFFLWTRCGPSYIH